MSDESCRHTGICQMEKSPPVISRRFVCDAALCISRSPSIVVRPSTSFLGLRGSKLAFAHGAAHKSFSIIAEE